MKNIILKVILIFLLAGINISSAQQSDMISEDNLLTNLMNSLPEGWEISTHIESSIIIRKDENVYVLFENRINAPVSTETRDQLELRVRKYGTLVKPHFEFKCYDRFSDEYIESSKKNNDLIYSQISSLPKKYDIEYLRDNFASSKGEEKFKGSTDEETKRIKKYEIEKYDLLNKIIDLPDYNSEKYSLYLENVTGIEDQMHLVSPYEISEEVYKIYGLLDKTLIKVK